VILAPPKLHKFKLAKAYISAIGFAWNGPDQLIGYPWILILAWTWICHRFEKFTW